MATSSKRRQRRWIMAGAIAGGLFLAGALIAFTSTGPARTDASGPDLREDRAAPSTSTAPQARTSEEASRDGLSEEGAVDAAVVFATGSQRWLYLSDDEIREAISQVATQGSAERLVEGVVADISLVRDQLVEASGRVWWLVRPLAWDVESYDNDEARVSVWVVTVLSAAGVASPQSEWMTVTLDLEWVAGVWRVDAVHDAPGPTPALGPRDRPWNAVPFDDALAGYTRIEEPAR